MNETESTFLTIAQMICEKHKCWIEWETSDIEKRMLDINGPSTKAMIDCAEELDMTMN